MSHDRDRRDRSVMDAGPNGISRRHFMTMGAAFAASLLSERVLAVPDLAASAGFRIPEISRHAWRKLERNLCGPVIRPGQLEYAKLALPNNLRYQAIRPAGIALCKNSDDIAECLNWCREFEVPLATRSGGHSYAGYSCTEGLMINVSSLDTITFDEATGLVSVAGGVRNGAVYSALKKAGRSLTHGRCTGVGAAGFLLGGGIGFDMRGHGVGSDKLVETAIVTADGALRIASESENSELFWACRGGAGGNFGINTSFTLQTFPVDRIVVFKITGWAKRA